ncbi:hypothetical protein RSPPQCQH_CDS0050 [Mycolicibacterium phage phi1_186001]
MCALSGEGLANVTHCRLSNRNIPICGLRVSILATIR